MSNYLVAMEAMQTLVDANIQAMDMFSRKNYRSAFDSRYAQLVPAFDALEELYTSVMEPQEMLSNMAQAVTDHAKEQIEGIKKKSQRETALMNMNMQLAVFVFPAILHYKGTFSEPLTKTLQQKWKEAFPKTNVQAAELETIEKGFQHRWCYITTAVCRTFGKPDDCYELSLFRDYRDQYLMQQKDGEETIREYYDVAPTIVKHIDERKDAGEIYQGIWDRYLNPCMHMIEEGNNEGCRRLYTQMVCDMKEEYFFNRKN